MKNLTLSFVVAVLLVLLAIALLYGINKQEVADCLTWQAQSKEYPEFYITQWQKAQCDAHYITVTAPVQ